jgi:WD40 repeat protein
MRNRFFFILLLSPVALFSQKGDPLYYQNATVQRSLPSDCYHKNMNAGIAAQTNGDCTEALRLFRNAMDCPDVQGNNRRINELNSLIELCNRVEPVVEMDKMSRPTTIDPKISARKYNPTFAFLNYNGDSCHDITRKEADRAFSLRYWDDAAKLYRAAKQCLDADQTERQKMNTRINACRTAAENELLEKEQEAIRQTRHAIADNLAVEAKEQLLKNNRTLAYRLADFANQYIAPDDNPKCIQAILDTWYNTPSRKGADQNNKINSPFCYQLAENLPLGSRVVCIGRGINAKIVTYVPGQNKLQIWDGNTFEPLDPVVFDEKIDHVECSPDGYTLVLTTPKSYILWTWQRQSIRLDVMVTGKYCFNAQSDLFYYYDPANEAIYTVTLKDLFVPRKGNTKKSNIQKYVSQIDESLQAMQFHEGKWWLAFPQQIVVLSKSQNGPGWTLDKKYALSGLSAGSSHVILNPKTASIVCFADSVLLFHANSASDSLNETLFPIKKIANPDVLFSKDAQHYARIQYNPYPNDFELIVEHLADTLFIDKTPVKSQELTGTINGDFSFDGKWLVAISPENILFAWEIISKKAESLTSFQALQSLKLTSDGLRLVKQTEDELQLVFSDDTKTTFDHLKLAKRPAQLNTVGYEWVAYQYMPDTICLHHFPSEKNYFFPAASEEFGLIPLAFSADEKLVAYMDAPQSITLRSLESGVVVASRKFDELIKKIKFIPQSQQMLVIQSHEDETSGMLRTVAKIWNYAQANSKPTAIRLRDYPIELVDVTLDGDHIALSDGRDVRIFSIDNLIDEQTRIYRIQDLAISAIRFSQNGEVIGVAYVDGNIEFWDTRSGQILNYLTDLTGNEAGWVQEMYFTNNGAKLRQINIDNSLIIRDIDPFVIGKKAQTPFRQLMAFTPAQIREYNLEDAMKYPGNFERMANSGEQTLIQAFFEYYHLQSFRSNNIEQVKNYCELASVLYNQLENNTQRILEPTILEMYRDFHWKWLLRENLQETKAIEDQLDRQFNNKLINTEMAAFSALQSGNLTQAVRLFAEWTLDAYNRRNIDDEWRGLDTLKKNFRQLAEYDLLKAPQRACICNLFSEITDMKALCPDGGKSAEVPFDPIMRKAWDILQLRRKADKSSHHERKIQWLNEAYQILKANRSSSKPGFGLDQHRPLVTEIANQEIKRGAFEQGSPRTVEAFTAAVDVLSGFEKTAPLDSFQLFHKAAALLGIGNYWLGKEMPAKAQAPLEAAANTLLQLSKLVKDTVYWRSGIRQTQTKVYERLGAMQLMAGKATDAIQMYELSDAYMDAGLNPFYYAIANVYNDDFIEAFLNFGKINDEEQFGRILYSLDRLARNFPARSDSIQQFVSKLKPLVFELKPSYSPAQVDYYFAKNYRTLYSNLEKWDSALVWSNQALHAIEAVLQKDSNLNNLNEWLDARIFHNYFSIMAKGNDVSVLNQVIVDVEKTVAYVNREYDYYIYKDFLKTNMAHAYILRDKPGDADIALTIYRDFLAARPIYGYDYQEVLEKDFRDIIRAGISFPNPNKLLKEILKEE